MGTKNDMLIVISRIRNSPNILSALNLAKNIGMPTMALTGFSGGKAAEMADISIHYKINNYAVTEDCHQIFMQCLAQFICKMREL